MNQFRFLLQKKQLQYWLLLIIFLVVSWPLLKPGMFKIHDFTHAARIAEMTQALQDGQFPVRWTQHFGFGYGMPLFEFYAPLPFYLGSIFYWLFGNLLGSVKFIFLLTNGLSLLGAYLLGKKLFKTDLAGIVTSLTFTLAPYRFLNLYIRGAASELWGIMALPWIIWSTVKLIHKEKWSWLWSIVSWSVLFLSHNISTLIFTPFIFVLIGLYLMTVYFNKQLNFKDILKFMTEISTSLLLAIGLSSFYLIPAFVEKDLTKVSDYILGYYFNYKLHFLYIRQFFRPNWSFGGSEWGPDDPISFFLGYGQLLVIVLMMIAIIFMIRKTVISKNRSNLIHLSWPLGLIGLFFVSLIMTTEKSQVLWHNISLLEFVQFPWRFLGMSIFILGLLAGWLVQYSQLVLLKLKKQSFYFLLVGTILVSLLFNLRFTQPETFIEDTQAIYYANPAKISLEMSQILPDYLPLSLESNIQPPPSLIVKDLSFSEQDYEVLVNRSHEKLIKFHTTEPLKINVALAYYPGWKAWNGLTPTELAVASNGTMLVNLNEGDNLIALKFTNTPIRLLSDLISLLSLLIIGLLIFINQINYQKLSVNQN